MRSKKLITALLAGLMAVSAAGFFTGCAKPADTGETEAVEQVETESKNILERLSGKSTEELVDNDKFIKQFNESIKEGKKFTSGELFTDTMTGRMKASLDMVDISIGDEDVQIVDKGGTSSVEPLVIWSAKTIDPSANESEIAAAFEKVEATDTTQVVGNIKIESKSAGDKKTYTVSENEKTLAKSEDPKDKEKSIENKDKESEKTSDKEKDKDKEKDDNKNTSTSNNTNNNSNTNNTNKTNTSNTNTNTAPAQQTQPVEQPVEQPSAPAAPVHVHSFDIPIYQTVHHDATGHYQTVVTGQQWVVDQAAWDEEIKESVDICQVCGYTCPYGGAIDIHIRDEHNWQASYRTEVATTGYVHHDEVGHYVDITEDQWVQDSAAYDSQEIVGYQCSCGATQ